MDATGARHHATRAFARMFPRLPIARAARRSYSLTLAARAASRSSCGVAALLVPQARVRGALAARSPTRPFIESGVRALPSPCFLFDGEFGCEGALMPYLGEQAEPNLQP